MDYYFPYSDFEKCKIINNNEIKVNWYTHTWHMTL